MKQKTPEQQPENPSGAELSWPPLDSVKERMADLDRMPDHDSDAFKDQLTDTYIEAGLLDKDLQTHLAASLEQDPRIVKFMREQNLPQWHQIDHRMEHQAA